MHLRSLAALILLAATLVFSSPEGLAQTPAPQSETHAAAPQAPPQSEAHAPVEGAHHGPEIKLFGMPLGQIGQFGVRVANFALFFAILYFALKGALSSAFKDRARELEDQLSQAEKDKADGEAQLQELEERMSGMQAELSNIMARAEAEAEAEKARILEAARAEAETIMAQTQSEIAFQKRLAEQELRALVAELATEGAIRRLEARLQGPVAEHAIDLAIETVGGAK